MPLRLLQRTAGPAGALIPMTSAATRSHVGRHMQPPPLSPPVRRASACELQPPTMRRGHGQPIAADTVCASEDEDRQNPARGPCRVPEPSGSGAPGRGRRRPQNTSGSRGDGRRGFWHARPPGRGAGAERGARETGSRLWCCEECRKEDKHFKGGFCSDRLLPPRRPSPPTFRHEPNHFPQFAHGDPLCRHQPPPWWRWRRSPPAPSTLRSVPRPGYRRPLRVFERPGMGVRLASESVFGFRRNGCSACAGIGVRHGPVRAVMTTSPRLSRLQTSQGTG